MKCTKCGSTDQVCQITSVCNECGDREQIVYRYLPKNEAGFHPITAQNFHDIHMYYEEALFDCITWPTTINFFLGWFTSFDSKQANDAILVRLNYFKEHKELSSRPVYFDFPDWVDRVGNGYIFYDEYLHSDGNPQGRYDLIEVLAQFSNCCAHVNQLVWAELDEQQADLDRSRDE